ncbi:hypothetical protein [Tranquillimonas alkanivorans]|uniref:5-aminolevulic acid synthase n=1 Tax=Tranquillimonas alkanivorans TaxID=441119 RepID=A0A1I5MJT0_9RHOB|nr:hypothetical protein [Tranquillimonas alkanivorans]SFP09191.1 hypothetical protein SAMN04488047_102279 [Tranquillimonas alkanivorans]
MRQLVAAVFCVAAGAASAQGVDGSEARAQLFPPERTGLQISSRLDETERDIVRRLIPLFEEQMGQPMHYYATIAYSPADGLVSESLQSAVAYHDTDAADRAALSACEAAAQSGGCEVAARVVPRGYEPRPLTLSSPATAAFFDSYVPADAPKALAISPSTGKYAVADGPDATGTAIARCRAEAGAADCVVAISD